MRNCKKLAILTAGMIMLIWGGDIALADDLSTWRYGSPGDVRRYGSHLMQERGHYNGRQGYGSSRAKAAYMDMMFRAGSPELYRYTQPHTREVKVYMNNSGETSQYVIPAPQKQRPATTWKPNYPKALVP
jgi:hypothetical protein